MAAPTNGPAFLPRFHSAAAPKREPSAPGESNRPKLGPATNGPTGNRNSPSRLQVEPPVLGLVSPPARESSDLAGTPAQAAIATISNTVMQRYRFMRSPCERLGAEPYLAGAYGTSPPMPRYLSSANNAPPTRDAVAPGPRAEPRIGSRTGAYLAASPLKNTYTTPRRNLQPIFFMVMSRSFLMRRTVCSTRRFTISRLINYGLLRK